MAINFSDPDSGFCQKEVVDFLNDQILQRNVSQEFCKLEGCESWGDLEKNLQDVLTDASVPVAIKKSCAWRALAFAVRLARKQDQVYTQNVKSLRDKLDEQKLLITALMGMVSKLRYTREKEREESQLQLQESLKNLYRAEGERNGLKNFLVTMFGTHHPKEDGTKAYENKIKETQDLGARGYTQNTVRYRIMKEMNSSGLHIATSAPPPIVSAPPPPAPPPIASVPPVAAAPPTPVFSTDEEQKDTSVYYGGNGTGKHCLPYPVLGTWSQTIPISFSLPKSSSSQTSFFYTTQVAPTAKTAADSSENYCESTWKGKHPNANNFMHKKFNLEYKSTTLPPSSKKRRNGDWDCNECQVMNFSWRNLCYRCKKFRNETTVHNFPSITQHSE